MINMRRLIKSKSGKTVEFKEVKGSITVVYQLDENNNRIPQRKLDGRMDFLIGLITG